MLLGTLGTGLLGNLLAGKGINETGKRMIKAGYGSKISSIQKVFNSTSSFNFKIQKYYQNELRFNGIYSRDSLSDKIKDEAYVIDDYSDTWTHWISLYALNNNLLYLTIMV